MKSVFLTRVLKFNNLKSFHSVCKITRSVFKQALEIFNILKEKKFTVNNIDSKEVKRNPYPPFSTSTLQQEANSKLNFNANQTMRTAQKLYEGIEIDGEATGLITYMRTDSIIMSSSAINETRNFIKVNYGEKYLPQTPRIYKSKTKNTQEAHECVRTTDIKIKPLDIKKFLREDEFKLYDLIII